MTSQEMIRFLESKGFTIKRKAGSHVFLKNPAYSSIVTIPIGFRGALKEGMILSIKKNIVEKGIITEQEFATAFN